MTARPNFSAPSKSDADKSWLIPSMTGINRSGSHTACLAPRATWRRPQQICRQCRTRLSV
eukprot:4145887-Prorocentrum_lima.AAC.1